MLGGHSNALSNLYLSRSMFDLGGQLQAATRGRQLLAKRRAARRILDRVWALGILSETVCCGAMCANKHARLWRRALSDARVLHQRVNLGGVTSCAVCTRSVWTHRFMHRFSSTQSTPQYRYEMCYNVETRVASWIRIYSSVPG